MGLANRDDKDGIIITVAGVEYDAKLFDPGEMIFVGDPMVSDRDTLDRIWNFYKKPFHSNSEASNGNNK